MKCANCKSTFKYIAIFCLSFLLTSCIEVKQSININKDGSGDTRLEIAIQKEWASQIIPKLKSEIPKGWNIVEEKEKEGKQAIGFKRKFKNISELNDEETSFLFTTERAGFLKKSYSLHIEQLKSSDMPFPYEVTIRVPGGVDETNGIKLSSNEVKWALSGLQKGKGLSIKSSALGMPGFASLKESFNKTFDSIFYREVIVFVKDRNLWIMDVNGGNLHRITDLSENENAYKPTCSPDGRKIAFQLHSDVFKKSYIYIVERNGTNLTQLTEGMYPDWSPNGKRIVFLRDDGIYIMNNDGSNVNKIPSGSPHDRYTTWSPDGSRIAFCRYLPGERLYAIFTVNHDGSKLYRLTKKINTQLPLWSPDGTKIAFKKLFERAIYIMDQDGSNIRKILDEKFDPFPFGWSSDSRKIVLVGFQGKDGIGIFLMDSGGNNLKQLTKSGIYPTWVSIPKITFMSPSMLKTPILIAIVLSGILFLFAMALIARKACKVLVIHKIFKSRVVSRFTLCTQCGKENSQDASFCPNCGHRMY